jgi:alpha-tubulin suppressor-like RCC1 family protein
VLKRITSKAGAPAMLAVVMSAAVTTAPAVARQSGPVRQVTAGGYHACEIIGARTYCWGDNSWGQLGDGTKANQWTAVPVRAPHGVAFTQLTAGFDHTCGISGTRAYCWGNSGTSEFPATPVPVRAPRGVVFTQLTAGHDYTCGIGGGRAYCWGQNIWGQLGNGDTTDQRTPVPVRAPQGVRFTQLTAGNHHACGIGGGRAYCWGNGDGGELGDGGTANQTAAVPVRAPRGVVFTRLAAGDGYTCGIGGAGTYCWGSGGHGQLGDGGTANRTTPVPVRAPQGVRFTQITAGFTHACGISGTGAYCWGEGADGKLGNGGTADRRTPVPVRAPQGVRFTQITAGYSHTCGTSGVKTWCWGYGNLGELGNASTATRTTPVEVQFARHPLNGRILVDPRTGSASP